MDFEFLSKKIAELREEVDEWQIKINVRIKMLEDFLKANKEL